MRSPDSWDDELLPREPRERPWARITPFARIISLLFFALFLYGLARDTEMPHLVDTAFMQIHAGGHALFRVFGVTAAVAGGTFLQLFVPFALRFFILFDNASHSAWRSACFAFSSSSFLLPDIWLTLKPSSYHGCQLAATNP